MSFAAPEFPAEIRRRMTLASFVPGICRSIYPTMEKVLERFGTRAPGWIDMKFDPATGADREASDEFYSPDKVYGWIQGRGLESMASHLRWAKTAPGGSRLDAESIRTTAGTLYRTIIDTLLDKNGILKAGFLMKPNGQPFSDDRHGGVTLSLLFILRGLFAWAALDGRKKDLEWIRPSLRQAVDAAIRGECRNDQLQVGSNSWVSVSPGRRGYEGQMIAVGACKLLYEHTGSDEDRSRGFGAIGAILSGFLRPDAVGTPVLYDYLDASGAPMEDNGHLTANPGHIIEFAGLALQFIRLAGGQNGTPLPSPDTVLALKALALNAHRKGRAPHGGIMRSLDAVNGTVLNGNCPWWSSFEAVRTFSELYGIAESAEEREYYIDQISSYMKTIETVYLGPSRIGVPVQTVSFGGEAVLIIPATPDIDPGYHTGIPLIDAWGVLLKESSMLCGSAEERIPPRLGVRLQGHLARTEPADSEIDPLSVRCLVLESSGSRVLLISVDVLEFSPEWAGKLTRTLATESGISEANIFLLATHTHTAPAAMTLGLLGPDAVFLESLEKCIRKALARALECMEPGVGLASGAVIEGIGVNRRFRDPRTGKVSMKPNPAGDMDDEVGCLFLFNRHGKLAAVLFNTAVHPTTLSVGIHAISPDYPGRTAAFLREKYGNDVVVMPIQGACGDVRPKVLDETGLEFAEGSREDMAAIARKLAEAIGQALERAAAGIPDWLDGSRLAAASRTVELPYAFVPDFGEISRLAAEMKKAGSAADAAAGNGFATGHDRPDLAAINIESWAAGLLETGFSESREYRGPRSEKAEFRLCILASSNGKSVQFFSIPGEAFCRIGTTLKLRARPSSLFVCGYCGGTLGYMPTKEAFDGGGYEVERAYMFYGRPAPLAPETETTIYSLYDSMRREAE